MPDRRTGAPLTGVARLVGNNAEAMRARRVTKTIQAPGDVLAATTVRFPHRSRRQKEGPAGLPPSSVTVLEQGVQAAERTPRARS